MNAPQPAAITAQPRPSVALVVLSLLVMMTCAVVAGLAAPLHLVAEFPTPIVMGFLLASGAVLIGVNQFLGTFRRWPGSALLVGLSLLFLATLWLIVAPFAILEPLVRTAEYRLYFIFSFNILLGVLVLWAGVLNLLWQVRLSRSARPSEPISLRQFSFQEVFLIMTVLAAGLASTGYQLRQIPPKWGENVEHWRARRNLPAEAQGICFSRSEGAMAVEFTVDEAAFQTWVTEGHAFDDRWQIPLQPISTTYEITRYWRSNREPAQKRIAKINRGLYLQNKGPGSSLQVVYDEEAGKVYLYETWYVNYDK